MSSITFKIGSPEKFFSKEKESICEMLAAQERIKAPSLDKLNKCKYLCVCLINGKIISIGAIKPKTESDFGKAKANLASLNNTFTWELGYCHTNPEYRGKGYCSVIVKNLVERMDNNSLMASTELKAGNPLVHILERFGFKQYGNPWKNPIHQGILGLFLRF